MRYIKYKNTNRYYNIALKEQYKSLTADEKRTFRKEKFWRKFSLIVSSFIFFFSVTGGFLMIKSIPQPSDIMWQILTGIGKVILGFLILLACGVITAGLTQPLWKKAESFHFPAMKREIISKACSHLRDYYGLQEPCIVTKCFDSTDKKFRNHDVCLFVVGDELRITADLMRGFLHGERDLGCYAFKKQEIMMSKRQDGKHFYAELNGNDVVFLLGHRAKGFIEKNFLASE